MSRGALSRVLLVVACAVSVVLRAGAGVEANPLHAAGATLLPATTDPQTASASTSRCRYCRSTGFGRGCPYSPHGSHEHVRDGRTCEFCGSSGYGRGCPYSPSRVHRHGQDGERCRWCGSRGLGRGCPYSPNRTHER